MISGIANIQYIYYYDIPEINSPVYFLNLLSTFLTFSKNHPQTTFNIK